MRLREILPRNRAMVSRLPTGAERLLICGFGFLLNYTTKFRSPNSCRAFLRLPYAPVLAGLLGFASRAALLPFPQFWPFAASLFSVFICLPRERARGHFLYWRGFRGDDLWLAIPVAVATACQYVMNFSIGKSGFKISLVLKP